MADIANPVVTAVGESRPDGERITKAIIEFDGPMPDVEGITVKDRTILSREVDGSKLILYLSEKDKASFLIPPPDHGPGGPGGPGGPDGGPGGPGGPKGPGGPGGSKGPGSGPHFPAVNLLPVQVTVDIPEIGEVASTKSEEPVIEDFVPGKYGPIPYSLYTPKNQEPGKKYPIVMFIPDAGVNGSDPKIALAQGIGATVWARPQEQEKRPCYVLAIQVPREIALTTDEYTCAPELETIKELLDKIVAENNIDPNRIYTTGQSQGCMASCELNCRYPDYFAASLLVSAHWDLEKMTSLTDKKFFFGLSSGGLKEFPSFNAITSGLAAKGVHVNRIHLNYRDGWEVNDARVRAVAPADQQVVYVIFDKETAFPDDGEEHPMIQHHNRGWELTYQLESAREWLFAQHKE